MFVCLFVCLNLFTKNTQIRNDWKTKELNIDNAMSMFTSNQNIKLKYNKHTLQGNKWICKQKAQNSWKYNVSEVISESCFCVAHTGLVCDCDKRDFLSFWKSCQLFSSSYKKPLSGERSSMMISCCGRLKTKVQPERWMAVSVSIDLGSAQDRVAVPRHEDGGSLVVHQPQLFRLFGKHVCHIFPQMLIAYLVLSWYLGGDTPQIQNSNNLSSIF